MLTTPCVPCVMCHGSCVTCHKHYLFLLKNIYIYLDKLVELVGVGSVINGAYPSSLIENYIYIYIYTLNKYFVTVQTWTTKIGLPKKRTDF